jgi:hypothetical protein
MFGNTKRMVMLVSLMVVSVVFSGCAYYGGMEVAMAEKQSSGALEKGTITTLAIAPVTLADREGKFGDVEGTTLEAYTTLSKAVDSKPDGQKFKVLTPVQFNAAVDSRMSEKEKTEALIAAGKKVGASHVLDIESRKLEAASGANSVLASQGLQKSQLNAEVFVKVINVKTGAVSWQSNFDATISYGMATGLSEAEVRKEIARQSVSAFLDRYRAL